MSYFEKKKFEKYICLQSFKIMFKGMNPYLISKLFKIFLKINIILVFVKLYHVRKPYEIIVSI